MKLTTGILAMAMVVGGSWAAVAAQNPDAIDNARSTVKSLQQNQANPAPKAVGVSTASKPAPGAPAPAVKPAVIPGSTVVAAKPASSSHNQLERVKVVPGAEGIAIEINSSQAVTPRVTKLSSPARVVVELPETVVASSQSKIPVGSAGVKGVRIGMDGKTPPTTSVVVDLEKPLAYDVTPGTDGKIILTLHSPEATPSVAKSGPAPAAIKTVKMSVPAAQPAISVKPAAAPAKVAVVKTPASKPAVQASKPEAQLQAKAAPAPKIAEPAASAPSAGTPKSENAPKQPKTEEKKWSMNGKRDPFFSPVVQTNGSGCSTGKKCLEINGINLRGVVKSDGGFIAVVTNNLNKAYFLRENDPVFNGYVVKITGDSVVFQETIQDKLGKPFTREIVKRIFTPAV
jgi:Tfp pilus assembly protein PilP